MTAHLIAALILFALLSLMYAVECRCLRAENRRLNAIIDRHHETVAKWRAKCQEQQAVIDRQSLTIVKRGLTP